MKYLLKFWDKKELVVSSSVGEQVKTAKLKGVKNIVIGSALYEVTAISYIEPIKQDKDELVQLPAAPQDPVKKETLKRMQRELADKFGWPEKKS